MPETHSKSYWNTASLGSFSFLLVTIFIIELAVMDLDPSFLERFNILPAALIDAGILVTFFSIPLLLFTMRFKTGATTDKKVPWRLFFRTLAIIFLNEFCVMLVLQEPGPGGSFHVPGIVDAGLTMLLSVMPLWWLFHHFEKSNREVTLAGYLNSPTMLSILLLYMLFLGHLLLEVLLPQFFMAGDSVHSKLASSVLTTLFVAPILWLLVTRPLQRAAISEQARTGAVYTQVTDALITFDAEGVIECFNPGAERIFGYPADLMLGQPVAQLFEDGDQLVKELIHAASSQNTCPDKVLSYELIGSRQHGSKVTMEVSISKMQLQDHPEFLLIMRDVTERKQNAEALQASETRFRQIFEKTDDAVIFLHPRNRSIIDLNTTMVNLLGYSAEELREGGLALIFRAEDCRNILAAVDGLARNENPQLENLIGIHKDGTELITSMRIKYMLLQDIEIIYCTLRDVTDRVRMEAEAREIQSKLIQANKMTALGLMVSGVAHEINNPNNFILTNSQLLEKKWQDASKILNEYYRENGDFLLGGLPYSQMAEQAPQLFSGIIEGSRRINEIVSNLKGFARQESVAIDNIVEINHVVKSAISILRHEIGRMTEDFRFEPGNNLPQVKGNRHQLGQVILNLLMNACQALPDKSASVILQTYFDEEANQIVVAVQDQGCGIPEGADSQIMEPFFTTKLDTGGTGLGLSICRTIIKDHNGTLKFHSEPGRGTTFVVRLPAMTAPQAKAIS